MVLTACTSTRVHKVKREIQIELENEQLSNQFTGLLLVDSETKDTIIAKNSNKYFIPASTAKLFTFYTANKLLGKKLPSLKYFESTDSLYIQGTGDPSWFHPYFKDSTVLSFLRNTTKPIVLYLNNFEDEKFRPGWAWEDYQYYFSPELGPMPLYGNVVTIQEKSKLNVSPNDFIRYIKRGKPDKLRELYKNEFTIPQVLKDTLQIPFITSNELTKSLLQQKLKKEIFLSKKPHNKTYEVLHGIATDSIYKRMLYESDNFLAEQMMLVASSTLSDTLSFDIAKDYVLEKYLSDLKQEPRWVDGSGLSRYNLFTPESMVSLLHKLYSELDRQRLFTILPAWDSNGTIKSLNSTTNHFIFAKSGSMGNTYNLCGYLKTKTGKTFIFSFMNNHFRIPSKEVRIQIEKTLKLIYDAY
ncbi:D-alanyl-D-alanine carboxypeptidase [uncultured Croceitalea sp.]|uniref:D-alanyl-D-alanine carboxypeptidase n=1 Tax=uncultured Croceitalea sp. TaxID=1798908 RepID=UPI00374F0A7C